MSAEHPILAIISPSGAGSSSVAKAFSYIFRRERLKAVYIQGSAFHRYERKQMQIEVEIARTEGRILSHYGPEGNHLDKLETLFFQYSSVGTGLYRYYLHSRKYADKWEQDPGTFTPWEELPKKSDLLFYRGLHGAAIDGDIDISRYPDLMIGIVPNVNLEWIRKIQRDHHLRNYSEAEIRQSIIDRMHDYIHHITPQFSRTHVNFQMIPLVDTSNPFSIRAMPMVEECYLVISFQNLKAPDFVDLLQRLPNSFMSCPNTIVVPGSQLNHAIEVIMMPLVHNLVKQSREMRHIKKGPKKKKSGLLGALGQSD